MSFLMGIYEKSPDFMKYWWRSGKALFAINGMSSGKVIYDTGIILKYMNKKKYHSQFGQDAFLDKIIFDGKKEGFFIDIGANHPKKLSNTLYFEKLGWEGIAFEPQPRLCKLWQARGRTQCFNYALGDKESKVEFAEYRGDDGYGSLAGVASTLGASASGERYWVRQRCLGNVLRELGIKKVDFVSMDVEGYEMNVLRGIDFKDVDIKCFVVENNKHRGLTEIDMGIRKFMRKKGYAFIGRIGVDDVFIKRG